MTCIPGTGDTGKILKRQVRLEVIAALQGRTPSSRL